MEFTQECITSLGSGEIFVFGSNEAGRHGSGSAKMALDNFNAKYGTGVGLQGQSYAIPTKDKGYGEMLLTLPIEDIAKYVTQFIDFANNHSDLTFYVTKIGCGLAGYTVSDIAPLFTDAIGQENIILPEEFYSCIIK